MALPLNDLESDSLREEVLICQKKMIKKQQMLQKVAPSS